MTTYEYFNTELQTWMICDRAVWTIMTLAGKQTRKG